jgi:hypothetical protein
MYNNDIKYDARHGGPYDRGGADYYYWRGFDPHYYTGNSITSERVEKDQMTSAELEAYTAGYEAAMAMGDRKDWGD